MMKKSSLPTIFCLTMASVALSGCASSGSDKEKGFPSGFDSLDDVSEVAYVIENATPDSVARFLCEASLGHVAEARIDTLALAAAFAYEHYNDSALIAFSQEFDSYSANLPLADKMRIYSLAGTSDPQRLGYELGLEYVSHIRESKMDVADIKNELAAFKKACADDSITYVRFLKGFKTVLKADHGKDLPEDIYEAFINIE